LDHNLDITVIIKAREPVIEGVLRGYLFPPAPPF